MYSRPPFMVHLFLIQAILFVVSSVSQMSDVDGEYPCQIEEESRQPHNFICDLKHRCSLAPDSYFSDGLQDETLSTNSPFQVVLLTSLFIVNNNTLLYSRSILDREALHRGGQCDPTVWQQKRESCVISVEVACMQNAQNPLFFNVPVLVKDVNDHAPDFRRQSLFTAQLQENEPANKLIDLPTAVDPDRGNNGTVTYKLEGDGANRFRLVSNNRNGGLQLKSLQSFDREKTSEFQFQLIASDSGTPSAKTSSLSLLVLINEVNEDAPLFSQPIYEIHIPENTSVGTVLKQVTATDGDKDSYVVITSPPLPGPSRLAQPFSIDSEGKVTLRRSVDYEDPEDRYFEIPLQAVDTGQPPKTGTALLKVSVSDVNDEYPKIEIRSLNSPRGMASFSVRENAPVKAFVAKVSATDADSGQYGQVECRLEQGSTEFILQQTSLLSGSSLSLMKNRQDYELLTAVSFDREVKEHYSVTITCSDRAPPEQRLFSSREISILIEDLNDNGPQFVHPLEMEKLMENQPVGTQVTRLTARDLDQGENAITHYEIAETYSHLVEVNRVSGVVTTKQVFDREVNHTVHFQAVAYDSKNTSMRSTVNYTVLILDENDNPPVMSTDFHFTVPEGNAIQIGQVTATDADDGINAKITFHLSDSYSQRHLWTVHSNGFISVASGSHLDREVQASYQVPIVAMDSGRPSLSTTTIVIIEVLDVNDCPPMFQEPLNGHGGFNVSRKTIPGTVVYRLKAVDKDIGENAKIRYYIRNFDNAALVSGEKSSVFLVDPESGDITLNHQPGTENRFPSKLIVVAEDHGQPSRSSTAFLDVLVVSEESKLYAREEISDAHSDPLVDSRGVPLDQPLGLSNMDGATWTKKMLIVLMVAFITLLFILIVAALMYFFFNCGSPENGGPHLANIKRREVQSNSDPQFPWLLSCCRSCRHFVRIDRGTSDRKGRDNAYSSSTQSNIRLHPDITNTRGISTEEAREMGQLLQRLPSSGYEAISGGGSMYQCMSSDPNSSVCAPYPPAASIHRTNHATASPTKRSFPPPASGDNVDHNNYWTVNFNEPQSTSYDLGRAEVCGDVWREKVVNSPRYPHSKQINSTVATDGSSQMPGTVSCYGYTPSGDTLHSATSEEIRGIFYSSSSSAPSQAMLSSQRHQVPRHLFGGSSGVISGGSNVLLPISSHSQSLNNTNLVLSTRHPIRQQSQTLGPGPGVGLINCYLKPIAASTEALAAAKTDTENCNSYDSSSNVNYPPPIYSTYGTTGRNTHLSLGHPPQRLSEEEEEITSQSQMHLRPADNYNTESVSHEKDGFLSRSGYVKGAPCYSSSFV